MRYVVEFLISFGSSLLAFALWTHYDLDGWWEQWHLERGRRREANEELRKKHNRSL